MQFYVCFNINFLCFLDITEKALDYRESKFYCPISFYFYSNGFALMTGYVMFNVLMVITTFIKQFLVVLCFTFQVYKGI